MASGEQLELEGMERSERDKHAALKTSAERREVIESHAKRMGLPVENFVANHRDSFLDPKMNAEMEKMHSEKQASSRGGARAGGGGGMSPADIEKVPGKRPLKMAKGGTVKSSASKRADGCAQRGKTRGKMV